MGQTAVDKVGQLEGLYHIAGDDVRAFLAERPETVEFLVEARPHIEKQFGKDASWNCAFLGMLAPAKTSAYSQTFTGQHNEYGGRTQDGD